MTWWQWVLIVVVVIVAGVVLSMASEIRRYLRIKRM